MYIFEQIPLTPHIMENPQTHSLGFLNRSIDKETAIGRTTQWRGLYKDTMKCKDPEVLRGYFIPIEDIISLYEFFKNGGVPLRGVRGYLGYDPLDPIAPAQLNLDLLLVPVSADGKDILEAPAQLGLGDGTSTIYDFSEPCPVECDTSSVLYADSNI
jgi:hypothetical protein